MITYLHIFVKFPFQKFTSSELKQIEKINVDVKENNILNIVHDNFGGYTAWQLRNSIYTN